MQIEDQKSEKKNPRLLQCCAEWEHNGYDDSDWYLVAWNVDEQKLVRIETESTRYAGGRINPCEGKVQDDPAEFLKASNYLTNMFFERNKRIGENQILTPDIEVLTAGVEVRILEKSKCAKKVEETVTEPCDKCSANPGFWVNPRNASDKRKCFACAGTGKKSKTTRVKEKTDAGKPVWEIIEAGTTGTVISQSTFGTFYRNGYNQPDRTNTTVYLKLSDGRKVQVKASKLRLDKQLPSDEEVLEGVRKFLASPEYGDKLKFGMFNAFYLPFGSDRSSVSWWVGSR